MTWRHRKEFIKMIKRKINGKILLTLQIICLTLSIILFGRTGCRGDSAELHRQGRAELGVRPRAHRPDEEERLHPRYCQVPFPGKYGTTKKVLRTPSPPLSSNFEQSAHTCVSFVLNLQGVLRGGTQRTQNIHSV